MKKSSELEKALQGRFATLVRNDQREIDNPDPYKPACRNYMDRIDKVISLIQERVPLGGQVAEIGCAQGNMSLLLAEGGYKVQAIDLNPEFLEYSRMKYEKGELEWVHSDLENLNPEMRFDAVILAEIIEHCAWPEKVIQTAVEHLRPGGLLIVTTPNAEKLREHLPTFSSFNGEEKRRELEKMQFGPAGEDHLFLFTMREMTSLVPPGAELVDKGYLGGSLAFNSRTHLLFKLLPLWLYRRLIRWTAHIPLVNRFSFHNIYMVLEKRARGEQAVKT